MWIQTNNIQTQSCPGQSGNDYDNNKRDSPKANYKF